MNIIPRHIAEMKLNIVYLGAAIGGKTTNLCYLQANLTSEFQGTLSFQDTSHCRYVFVDFVSEAENELKAFRLQCLSGCAWDWKTCWEPLFIDVNAIVFVVDSQKARLDGNIETLELFTELLQKQGGSLESFPWVIQYNKRDLPGILPLDELQRQLNPYNVPHFEAVATQGIGVCETLRVVLQRAVEHIRKDRTF